MLILFVLQVMSASAGEGALALLANVSDALENEGGFKQKCHRVPYQDPNDYGVKAEGKGRDPVKLSIFSELDNEVEAWEQGKPKTDGRHGFIY